MEALGTDQFMNTAAASTDDRSWPGFRPASAKWVQYAISVNVPADAEMAVVASQPVKIE